MAMWVIGTSRLSRKIINLFPSVQVTAKIEIEYFLLLDVNINVAIALMVRTASTNVFVSTTAHAHLIQDNVIAQPGSKG